MRAAAILYDVRVFRVLIDYNIDAACVGINLGACRPIDNYSLKEQTAPNQNRSFLWSLGVIQLGKRPNS